MGLLPRTFLRVVCVESFGRQLLEISNPPV